MRSLHADLTTEQQATTGDPYVEVVLTSPDGNTTLTYTTDNVDEIKRIEHHESVWGSTQRTFMVLSNHDQAFTSLDLRGYKAVVKWGFNTASGNKTSTCAPQWVYDQREISEEGVLLTELECVDIWWRFTKLKVVGGGTKLDGSITGTFTLGEAVTSSGGATALKVLSIGTDHIVVTGVTGTFGSGETVTGDSSSATIVLTSAGTAGGVGAAPQWPGDTTIFNILASLSADVATLVDDTGAADARITDTPTYTTNRFDPIIGIMRRMIELTASGLKFGDEEDEDLHLLYLNPAPATDYSYDGSHAFFIDIRQRRLVVPNKVFVVDILPTTGDDMFTKWGVATDTTSVDAIGAIPIVIEYPAVADNAEAALYAATILKRIQEENVQGRVLAPMNCGQEILDWVSISDTRANMTVTGRVGWITRRFEPGTYSIEVRIGGLIDMVDTSSPTALMESLLTYGYGRLSVPGGVITDPILSPSVTIDSSALTYTPAVLTDWDGDADPGNVDDALDQLAERVDDNEIAIALVGSHAILDGSVHTDSVAQSVTRGSLIYGNSTPKWGELGISIPGSSGARNALIVDNGDSDISWKSMDLLVDADGDTKIQVEESADEDIIRFDAAGTELMCIGREGAVDIFHTAAAANEHALELDVDAAGYGDVLAVDIVYDTGAQAIGSDDAVILVNIDESDATGGDVAALEVLSTEGSATIFALEVGAVVHPIEHLSGTFANMDSALVNAVDRLTEFTTSDPGGANNVEMFSSQNDTVTIGDAAKFEEIEFLLETVASGGGIKPTFEYSTGAGPTWSTFSPTDGTNGLRNTGVIAWLDTDIPSWAQAGGEYLIRITRTRASLTTKPKEDKVQIAAVTIFSWDKDGDVVINNLNVAGDITVGGTVDGVDIAARDHAKYTDAEAITAIEGEATLDLSGNVALTSGYMDITEQATPANPAANVGRLYVADDGGTTTLYFRDSAGAETDLLAGGGGGVAAHAILDGSVHTDSVADGVTRGSIIIGNATPKWDELVIGGANTYLKSDGTDIAWAAFGADAIAAVEGEATLDLSGDVTIAKGLTIADATPGDDFLLLRFNTSRPWRFETEGADGPGQSLALRPENDEDHFSILSQDGNERFFFYPKNVVADSFVNVAGTLYVNDIGEYTGGVGITIDSVLLKDGLVDGIDVAARDHAESHTAASHSDQGATGAELEELTDASETTLHSHAGGAAPQLATGGWSNPEATSFSSSGYAWKGNYVKPLQETIIYALGVKGDFPQGITLKFGIFTVKAGPAVDTVVGKTPGVTLPGALDTNPSNLVIWDNFASPITLAAGTKYLIMVGRTDGAGNYGLPITYLNNIKPAPFGSHEMGTGTGRIAEVDPVADDTINDHNSSTVGMYALWKQE